MAWLRDLRLKDIEQVGGKNASPGEMIGGLAAAGIRVPDGFATTAQAFREFIDANGLGRRIDERLSALDPEDVTAFAACGAEIRSGSPGHRSWQRSSRRYARIFSSLRSRLRVTLHSPCAAVWRMEQGIESLSLNPEKKSAVA